MFGLFRRKRPQSSSIEVRRWSESLGQMTMNFRLHFIGQPRSVVVEQVRSSWFGAEVDSQVHGSFTVRQPKLLAPFTFIFESEPDGEQKVTLVVTKGAAPFENVMLATNAETTNYLVNGELDDLNEDERLLCKYLEEFGRIPRGRTAPRSPAATGTPQESALGPVVPDDSRPIVGMLALGMAVLIYCRGEGGEKFGIVGGPLYDLVRGQTDSDEKAVEVVKFNIEQACSMPPETLQAVAVKFGEQMSMRAKHEIGVGLMWYADFMDDVAGPSKAGRELSDGVIEVILTALGVLSDDYPMLRAQARQRLAQSRSAGNSPVTASRESVSMPSVNPKKPDSSPEPEGPVGQTSVLTLPGSQDLRRALLGIVVANLVLDAKLRAANREHELGDPGERHDALLRVVSNVCSTHGETVDRSDAEQALGLVTLYLQTFLDAMELVVNALQNPDALLRSSADGAGVERLLASMDIEARFNGLLPPTVGKLNKDDLKAIEAGVAQGEREAEK